MISEVVINEFVAECHEHLNATEQDLLAMENGGQTANSEVINRVFRAVHSIKGASGTFGFNVIMELSHAMENVLLLFRNGKMAPDRQKISILLDGVDKLRLMTNDVRASEEVPCEDELRRLNRILRNEGASPSVSPDIEPEIFQTEPSGQETVCRQEAGTAERTRSSGPETIRVNVELLDMLMNLAGELVLSRNQLRQFLENTIHENPKLNSAIQNVDLVTSEIQDRIMQMRMQPLSNILNRLMRQVRDLADQLGKEVSFITEGGDVELDKSILEGLSDPLMHIIRNCVDHGIEPPQERSRLGKPSTGEIRFRAFHEGGQVNITITDDGGGIDPEKVVRRAMANGALTADDARRMSEKEKLHMVFLPGFSLAGAVTDISGRGVGMDVVKTNIERLGGYIELDSTVGAGATIRIRLPLTLAIIPSIIVRAGRQRFAIPQVNVQELVGMQPEEVGSRIEKVGEAPVLRLRERLLSLVRLADILGYERTFVHPETRQVEVDRRANISDRRAANPSASGDDRRKNPGGRRVRRQGDVYVVVLRVGENVFGLIVDELFDIEEIVVKPLSGHIKDCQCFAGATIMGDGRVAMILDASGIADFAGLRFGEVNAEEMRRQREALRSHGITAAERRPVIVFNCSPEEYFALPLGGVSRLERIDRGMIETLGNKEYITYRGMGLPLIHLDRFLPVRPLPEDTDELFVIIPKPIDVNSSSVGILASKIMDTVEAEEIIRKGPDIAKGFLGAAVVEGKMTMFLDTEELLNMFYKEASRG